MSSPFNTIFPNKSGQCQNEVRMHLYLCQVHVGPNHNQETILRPNNPLGMGTIGVTDWTIIDKPLYSNVTTVGHAKGMHFDTGSGWWYMTFNLRFEDARFNGSTLQVMGFFSPEGEWSIVGGTGEFSMAHGTINYKTVQSSIEGVIRELDIQAFYTPKTTPEPEPKAQKLESWGGSGGSPKDITEPPKRLESISIWSATVIDSIAFSYTDEAGKEQSAGPWGGTGGTLHSIQLAADEFLKEVSGTYGTFHGATVISSLKFVTNVQTWAPWGEEFGTNFSICLKSGQGVAGFYVKADKYVDKIGLYIHPV